MKNFKNIIIYLFILIPLVSCASLKKSLTPQKKSGSEEFLVEKKSPLSMPPDFDELPTPQNQNTEIEAKEGELKVLLEDLSKSNNQINNQEQDNSEIESFTPEGVEGYIDYRGEVSDIIYQMLGGIRSGLSYCGVSNIKELHDNPVEYSIITDSGKKESGNHGIRPL